MFTPTPPPKKKKKKNLWTIFYHCKWIRTKTILDKLLQTTLTQNTKENLLKPTTTSLSVPWPSINTNSASLNIHSPV